MVVVCCSGGVDSSVLAGMAARAGQLAALWWADYGQPASLQEWRAARELSKKYRVPMQEAPLTTVWSASMQTPTGAAGPRIVPVRNLIFLAHAANYAASIGANEVQFGAIADDQTDYMDCRSNYVVQLSALTEPYGVRVSAPLIRRTKAEVIRIAHELGVFDGAWSCYAPTSEGTPCGLCNSCNARTTGTARR